MTEVPLRILQVSTSDIGGGAEKVAWDLFNSYRARGLKSQLAVGTKLGNDPDVLLLPLVSKYDHSNRWMRGWLTLADKFSASVGKVRGAWKARNLLRIVAQPRLLLELQRGHEDFDFLGSRHLLDFQDEPPNILHCHNLHGGYFDLQSLPALSRQIPTFFTLHDTWMLSGHCAYSFTCERWKTGCGHCPDLATYPSIRRDATAYNWQRKREIYLKSRVYVATPSQWLMASVEQSMLAAAIEDARVIPNGIDLEVFHPGDKRGARLALNIPPNAKMVLHVGYSTKSNPRRDYAMLELAVKIVAERFPDEQIILVCVGEDRAAERIGRAEIRFIGYQANAETVATFYQAADIYLHPAKVDNFPNVVLEAFACGTPVVATAVGGIPEQVRDGVTGFLVPSGDVEAMARQIIALLSDDAMRYRFGLEAIQDARERFDLNRQVDAYAEWYRIVAERRSVGI